jgi:hypothetical protein
MSKKDPIQELVRTYYGNNPFRPNDERVHELEVRFGTKGGINRVAMTRNDYDNVIKKLKSSGFRQTTVDTSGSSILRIYCETNRTIRTDILGLFAIQQYCRTNRLPDNPELCTMTIKQPLPSIKPVDIDDFRFRVSYQTEDVVPKADKTNLENNWSSSKKEFRYLNRVSFVHESFPCIVDISIVKYSSTDSNGKSVRTFKVSDSGVFRNQEGYEFEIEIDPARIGPNTPFSDASKITHALRSVIMLVLSGIQMSNFPISYSEQDRVREEYMALLWSKEERDKIRTIGNKYFMGPQSITLQLEHIGENSDADSTKDNNIRTNYVVTDKADGMRHLLFVNGKGNIYLIRTNMSIVFTGARTKNEQLFQSILDGELITHDKNGNYIQWLAAFDIYYFHKRDVRALPFIEELEGPSVKEGSSSGSGSSRYHLLQTLVQQIEPVSILQTVTKSSVPSPSSPLQLTAKQFFVPTQTHTIFDGCKLILDKNKEGRYPYHIDGLIVSHAYFGVGSDKRNVAGPKTQTTWEYSFKWKPPENNTVDFLVNTVKDANNRDEIYSQFEKGINQCTTVQSSQYKMVELMCGFNPQRDGMTNACQLILNGLKNQSQSSDPVGKNEYLPMRFYPTQPYDPTAGLCRIPLISDGMGGEAMFAEDGDSFTDHMIVEFRYDLELVTWIPIKVRYDKTSRLLNGEKEYGNSYKTCNDNWKSINPLGRITETMLTTGADIPSILVSEDMYYNTNGGKSRSKYQTTAMKNFHNLFVKHMLLCNMARPGNTLIDFACGKAGDLPKWVDAKYSFVLGIDYSLDNLANPMDGACARYVKLNQLVSRIPDALFLNGNSGKNIRDGTAFFTEMDKQIASAVFGQTKKGEQGEQNNLGKGVVKQMGKGESGFSISSCQFAMHYFFESPLMLTHFLRNVMENTQLNGYFVGTCYDGMAVFQELKNVKRDHGIKLVENGTLIWELIKRYDDALDFQENSSSIGLTVDVFQESIGQTISEYLVHFGYFQRLMDTCGFELLSVPEARAAGFPSGTGMFKSLFDLMVSKTKNVGTDANPYGKALQMTEFEKKISFLNRYFIFKKVREINSNDVRIDLTEYELNKQGDVKEPIPEQEQEQKADAKAKGAEEPIVKKRTTRKKIVDSKDKNSLTKAKIAIIVPYRVPVTHASDRAEQLVKFTETMTRILSTHGTDGTLDFKLYVIEQSQDGRLFNRGHLLNIGFSIAQKDGCTNFIFHDVDLLPSESLMHYYINQIPDHKVMHIAGTWGRYGLNATGKINHNYLGGITGFSETTFKEINGFPNNFWGWGGEDDELLLRIKSFNQSQTDAGKQITIIKPGKEEGTITDLENMDITQKMAKLKETKEKGMMKKERLAEHADTYRTNGLSNLDNTFHIISHSACVPNPKGDETRCEKWVVELKGKEEGKEGKEGEKGEEGEKEEGEKDIIVPVKTRKPRAKKIEQIQMVANTFIPEPILAVEQALEDPVKKPRKPRTKKATQIN